MLNGSRKHHAQMLFSDDGNGDCVLNAVEAFPRGANLEQLAALMVREGKFAQSIRIGRRNDTVIGGIQKFDESIFDRHSLLIDDGARQMPQSYSFGMKNVGAAL